MLHFPMKSGPYITHTHFLVHIVRYKFESIPFISWGSCVAYQLFLLLPLLQGNSQLQMHDLAWCRPKRRGEVVKLTCFWTLDVNISNDSNIYNMLHISLFRSFAMAVQIPGKCPLPDLNLLWPSFLLTRVVIISRRVGPFSSSCDMQKLQSNWTIASIERRRNIDGVFLLHRSTSSASMVAKIFLSSRSRRAVH